MTNDERKMSFPVSHLLNLSLGVVRSMAIRHSSFIIRHLLTPLADGFGAW
jgi:hypothetical protein